MSDLTEVLPNQELSAAPDPSARGGGNTFTPYGRFRSVTHYRLIQKPCRRIPQVQEMLFGDSF